MAEQTIEAGSEVMLKSGGPSMTVKLVEHGEAWCVWFHGTEAKEKGFATATLKLVDHSAMMPGVVNPRPRAFGPR